jgi:hypothetical protein
LITHLGVIALFSSIYFLILILFVLNFKNYLEIEVKFKFQKCAPKWVMRFTSKIGGWVDLDMLHIFAI